MVDVNIENYWHASDGDDWSPALARAQASVANLQPLTIRLLQRQYRCLTPVEIFHQVLLLGPEAVVKEATTTIDNAGAQVCTLYFPQSGGLIFQYPGQYGPDPTARSEAPALRNVQLRGPGSTYAGAGARDMHGITVLRTAEVSHFCVRQFPGNGVHISADHTASPAGNANFSLIQHGLILENGGCGVYNAAGDGSHCRFDRISCDNNGLWARVWSASPTSMTAASGIVTATFSSLPTGIGVGELVYSMHAAIGALAQDWQLGVVTSIAGTVVTIDTTRDAGVVGTGTYTATGTLYGLRTYATTAATAGAVPTSGTVDFSAVNDVRPGDIVLATGFTANGGGSGDFTFGVVAASGSSSTVARVETFYDLNASIPSGAFVDGVGTISIRPAQFYGRAFLGSLFTNCDVSENQNGGEGFVGINANLFLFCYTEGAGPIHTAKIRPPGFSLGGVMAPDPGSSHLGGSLTMLNVVRGLQATNPSNTALVSRLGANVGNGVFEFQNGAFQPFRLQFGLSEPNSWELAYGNAPLTTTYRIGDGANTRLGVSEFWMPRGLWYGGIAKESENGTSNRRGVETGTIDGNRCLFDIVFADNVATTLTSGGTAALNITTNLPVFSADGTRDLRIVTRNVGGTPVVNGVRRGRVSASSVVQLRAYSDGSALTLTGSYTSGTGVMAVYRAIIDALAPPSGATFYAVGDIVRNQDLSNGVLYWVCIESGTPGRWAPVRASGAAGLVAATAFPFTASAFDDVVLVDGGASAKTINLPALATHHTRRMVVKDRLGNAGAVNTITVTANGTDTIDGAASRVINTAFGVLRLQGGNGPSPTNWSII